MKKQAGLFLVMFIVVTSAFSQKDQPQLMKEPLEWEFERFELPPVFAPGIPFKGVEELRFSPGMFHADSASYFTYAFVAELENTTAITQSAIQDYLLHYFRGLCSVTAKDRKLSIDSTKISVSTSRKKDKKENGIVYNALLHVFGVFTDGAPVLLNMEVKVLPDPASRKTYLLFVTSPRQKSDPVWQQLYKIQREFSIPGRVK